MRDAMVSRGPDDAGLQAWDAAGSGAVEECSVGLAHRRLSIIDLSPAGHQPMSNEDGSVWIAYNGEFYNFQDYRKELEAKGHIFRSHCDTETIVHLYEEYGIEETLRRMNGMFAFALWDARCDRLVLARDRAGQKPLFYAELPGGRLLFGSEIKALMASGCVDREKVDDIALAQFWTYGYAGGERTFYRQVRKLPPAHYAVWEKGSFSTQRYWQVDFGREVDRRPVEVLADELEELLTDSIRLRLIADVPLGLFLSGGIDSSLMAALTARKLERKVTCYTIGFSEKSHDESPFAARIANHLDLPHVTMHLGVEQMSEFERIADYYDEPFGDPSAIPTWYVCKLARQEVTVVLSGDAGDELFAGYGSYPLHLALWGSKADRANFRHLVPNWPARYYWINRLARGNGRYNRFSSLVGDKTYLRILPAGTALMNMHARHAARNRQMKGVRRSDLLSRLQHLDFHNYMHEEVLTKVDRSSMAHSLECRSPFLDYRVVEFAARLPREAKLDAQGNGKLILRHLLGRYVPEPMWNRPKMGFAVPFEQWCAGSKSQELNRAWKALDASGVRKNAADMLFPVDRTGNVRLTWNGFSAMRFF
jgi:asparagine synthase (glutamine-hydrolysing)